MKKIIILLVAGILVSSAMFAFSFEWSLNYQAKMKHSVTPTKLKVIDNDALDAMIGGDVPEAFKMQFSHTSFAGFTTDMNFYFAHPNPIDIGLAFGGGFSFLNNIKIDETNIQDQIKKLSLGETKLLGFEPFGKVGLATRFNIHKNHAIYFSPSFIVGIDIFNIYGGNNGVTNYGHILFYGLDLDVAYQLWFTKAFGLMVGVNFNTPLGMRVDSKDLDDAVTSLVGQDTKIWLTGVGTAFKFHLGVVLNLGKKATGIIH